MKKCVHYWLCEEAHGKTSRAVCKWCGAKAEFYNSYEFEERELIGLLRLNKLEPEAQGVDYAKA